MNRREFLKKIGLIAAGALVVPAASLAAAESSEQSSLCVADLKKKNAQPPGAPKSPNRPGKPNLAALYGKVRIVTAGEQFRVRVVSAGEDLRVRTVSAGANAVGQWEIVDVGEKFTIRFVTAGEDFTIRFVTAGEGL